MCTVHQINSFFKFDVRHLIGQSVSSKLSELLNYVWYYFMHSKRICVYAILSEELTLYLNVFQNVPQALGLGEVKNSASLLEGKFSEVILIHLVDEAGLGYTPVMSLNFKVT